jgi:hypothetical protein
MNIIELAKQVGYPIQHLEWQKATEEFAALVEAAARADEREACARKASIALLGADKALTDRVLKAIRARETT